MSQAIKDNERYGLGKAIGDKAAHLFVKWYIHSFGLAKKTNDMWNEYSYELPWDSNVGRILFRTGFLLMLASLDDYKEYGAIKPDAGKKDTHYLRVTEIRKRKPTSITPQGPLGKRYFEVMKQCFGQRKKIIEIQRLPNVLLVDTGYTIADLDEGIIHIGTTYCLNNELPKCKKCPINRLCEGHQQHSEWITSYRT
jgi:hypothetical protein